MNRPQLIQQSHLQNETPQELQIAHQQQLDSAQISQFDQYDALIKNGELDLDVNLTIENMLPQISVRQQKKGINFSANPSQFEMSFGKSKAYRSISNQNSLTESSINPLKPKFTKTKLQPLKFQNINHFPNNNLAPHLTIELEDDKISLENNGRASELQQIIQFPEIQKEEINLPDSISQETNLIPNRDVLHFSKRVVVSSMEKPTQYNLLDHNYKMKKLPHAQMQIEIPSTRTVKLKPIISQSPQQTSNNSIVSSVIQSPQSSYSKHVSLIQRSNQSLHNSTRKKNQRYKIKPVTEYFERQHSYNKSELNKQDQISIFRKPEKLWYKKVETLKEQLEIQNNIQCIQTENRIKEKQQVLASLINYNILEYDLVKNQDQDLNLQIQRQVYKSLDSQYVQSLMEKLEELIKKESNKRDELSEWGLSSYVIECRQKLRQIEQIIDRVQQVKVKQSESKICQENPFEDNQHRGEHPKNWRKFNWFRISFQPIQLRQQIKNQQNYEEGVVRLEQRFQQFFKEFELIISMSEELIAFIGKVCGGAELLRKFKFRKLNEYQSMQMIDFENQVEKNSLVHKQSQQIEPRTDLKKEPFESKWLKALTKGTQIEIKSKKEEIQKQVSQDLEKQIVQQELERRKALQNEKYFIEKQRFEHIKNLFEESSEDVSYRLAANQNIEKFMQEIDSYLYLKGGLIEDWFSISNTKQSQI